MPTIKDVAALAGVSFSTVSIIINGKSEERKISLKTQKKVLEAMKELNYKPNISAKKLRNHRSTITIALFWTTDFRSAMLARFMKGLQDEIRNIQAKGDCVEIVIYPYENGSLRSTNKLLAVNDFNGTIIANASPEDMAYIHSINLLTPVILYNRQSPIFHSINIDDREIGRQASRILKNYNQALFVQAPVVFDEMNTRANSFVEEFHGSVKIKEVRENSAQAGFELASDLNFSEFDCIFASSDAIALGIEHYCYQNRISIPSDLGLLAVGNGLPQYDAFANPALSVIEIPIEHMAAMCLDGLVRLIHNEELPMRQYTQLTVIQRDSVK